MERRVISSVPLILQSALQIGADYFHSARLRRARRKPVRGGDLGNDGATVAPTSGLAHGGESLQMVRFVEPTSQYHHTPKGASDEDAEADTSTPAATKATPDKDKDKDKVDVSPTTGTGTGLDSLLVAWTTQVLSHDLWLLDQVSVRASFSMKRIHELVQQQYEQGVCSWELNRVMLSVAHDISLRYISKVPPEEVLLHRRLKLQAIEMEALKKMGIDPTAAPAGRAGAGAGAGSSAGAGSGAGGPKKRNRQPTKASTATADDSDTGAGSDTDSAREDKDPPRKRR